LGDIITEIYYCEKGCGFRFRGENPPPRCPRCGAKLYWYMSSYVKKS